MALFSGIKRGWKWAVRHPLNGAHYFYNDYHIVKVGASLGQRWYDLSKIADFRLSDRVLDMGCAEGLLSLEVAKMVAHVDGIDFRPHRIKKARREAAKSKLDNVTFSVGSIVDLPLVPDSYDVVLLLSVLSAKTDTGRVGLDELARLLPATRRQIIIRDNIARANPGIAFSLADILSTLDENGFDGICFPRIKGEGNLIVGSRRGTDARLSAVPPCVVIPTQQFGTYSWLDGGRIGEFKDFVE